MIGFEFKGMFIVNPFESECGRFVVEPSYYGFGPINTGGGCMALELALPDGGYILITDNNCSIPAPDTKPEDILIGRYNKEGEEAHIYTLADVIELTNEK